MSLRRGGTPLNGIPSLEASNQAQIEDLVQRNRTLEHTNKKLLEQVAQEKARAADAVSGIQKQWEVNKQKWKEAVDDLVATQRIVEKQVEVELEKERAALIKEMAVTREEKVQRIHRDYKIKLFQIREEELERKIEELEEEIATLQEEHDFLVNEERLKAESLHASLKETKLVLSRTMKDKEGKDSKYSKLLSEHSNLEAKNETLESKLQRAQLQLESLQTKVTNMEAGHDELRRKNIDLTQQLERWKDLDTKGVEKAEKEHKKCLELEVEIQELREEMAKQKEEWEADLSKERARTTKAKDKSADWEAQAKQHEKHANETTKQMTKLQRQCDKLKAELEVERARVRPLSPTKHTVAKSPTASEDESQREIEEEPTIPETKQRSKKSSGKQHSSDDSDVPAKAGPSTKKQAKKRDDRQVARKTTGGRPPPKTKKVAEVVTNLEADDDSDDEEGSKPNRKKKGKGKEKEDRPSPAQQKGKRKARASSASLEDDVDDIEIIEAPKAKKARSKVPSDVHETATSKAKVKASNRAVSKQPKEPVDKEDIPQPQKKKRKIVNSAAPTGPFAFQSLKVFDDQINALNIPSTLSPVRPDEAVPQRSTAASSAMGSIATLLKLPLSRK
ncbi:hypothetical protein D9613_007815 [Agrocybe pediades]|uniref:Uncharacterized protein n=1 Tax=Agrocybe pediades TaxID=84607 RepID=A0A8H4QNW2_9AGAR|nr:hypothetical protein D9613_007815 [Agrocybe pediades]